MLMADSTKRRMLGEDDCEEDEMQQIEDERISIQREREASDVPYDHV